MFPIEKLTFKKPLNWNSLPMYKQIQYYKTILDEKYSKYVDKLEVKELLITIDGLKTAKIIKILKNEDDLLVCDLIIGNIIKANHGSGWNIFINNKTKIYDVRKIIKLWLSQKYTKLNEKQYQFIQPKVFIEEVIDDYYFGKSDCAVTYMFRCVHGIPHTFSIKKKSSINSFDINLNLLKPIEHDITKIPDDVFIKMKEYATQLSKNFEFVRIDFYFDKMKNIYFSEFTFTPSSGLQYFDDKTEIMLGKLWI
jgi:hypothetical protein